MMSPEETYGVTSAKRLRSFVALLTKWNPAINLVSVSSMAEVWTRHIADSAQLLQHAPAEINHWVDFGSGAGFPGAVVALLSADRARPFRMTLIEADQRKAAFLSAVSRETSVAMTVIADRIEAIPRLHADVVSARALATLDKLCAYSDRHLEPSGTALFLKGANYNAELPKARSEWSFSLREAPSISDPASRILELKDLRRV